MNVVRILFVSVLIGGLLDAQSLSETIAQLPGADSNTPTAKQDAVPEVATLYTTIAANEADRAKWVAGLENWYLDGLGKLLAERTKAGDLDGALLVKAERERITTHAETTAGQIEAMPVALRTLRGNYDGALKKISDEITKRNLAVGRKIVEDLDALQKKITVSGDLDRALLVKAEKERVAAQVADGSLGSIALLSGIRASPPAAVKPPSPTAPPGTFVSLEQIIKSAPADVLQKLQNNATVGEGLTAINDYLAKSVKGQRARFHLTVETAVPRTGGPNKLRVHPPNSPVMTWKGGEITGRLWVYFPPETEPPEGQAAVGSEITVTGVIKRCDVSNKGGLVLSVDLGEGVLEGR